MVHFIPYNFDRIVQMFILLDNILYRYVYIVYSSLCTFMNLLYNIFYQPYLQALPSSVYLMVTSNSTIHLTKIKATTDRYILVCHCKVSDSKRASEWTCQSVCRSNCQLDVYIYWALLLLCKIMNLSKFTKILLFLRWIALPAWLTISVSFPENVLLNCISCFHFWVVVFSVSNVFFVLL